MTGPDELTTADGRDRAIRDRCAAFMASAGEIVVAPSGFEDEPCWDCQTMGNRICGPVSERNVP